MIGGVWKNVDDGNNTVFFDWASGQPTTGIGYDCALMNAQGYWYTAGCNSYYYFICGLPEIDVNPTTPSISTTPINNPSTSCWSYIPLNIDITGALTSYQYSKMINFITTYFMEELFPIDLQPAELYGYHSYFDLQFNISEVITTVKNTAQIPYWKSDLSL